MDAFVAPAALDFLRRTTAREDALLRRLRQQVAQEGLPSITPEAGRTLQVLTRVAGARHVLEVGTCLGYSALWLARGVGPRGRVDTWDLLQERADAAAAWARRAKLQSRIRFHVGDAHQELPRLPAASYDLVFIDADKEGMPAYLRQAVRLLRPGGLLTADNVFWGGSAFDETDARPGAAEVRSFVRAATRHPRLEATILPLGDGLLVARRS
jgi:predicted O-methyltransferase YrrM